MHALRIILFLTIIALSSPAWAQELNILGGVLQNRKNHDRTYTWQLEYRQNFHEHLAFSITYLNEGAFSTHSRDGHSLQLWARAPLLDNRLVLSFGAGPYFYYDTIPYLSSGYSLNDHGWGALLSFDAAFYTHSPWLVLLRTNWVETGGSIDTVSAMLGVGYRLDGTAPASESSSPNDIQNATRNEISIFAGQTSVHNKGPAHSLAAGIEYRRLLLKYLEGTAGFLYEGNNSLSRRYGVILQAWLARSFFKDRLHLGIGFGPYFSLDRRKSEKGKKYGTAVSEMLSITAGYHMSSDWGTRFSWNRVITNYERDADIWLIGICRQF